MVSILTGTTSGLRLTYVMSEEMKKTPYLEIASSSHGITHSSFPPPLGKFYSRWLMEDSFPVFVPCNNVVALPSEKWCCLIVQQLSSNLVKLLWKAEPTDHMADSIEKVGGQHVGLFSALASLWGGTTDVFLFSLHTQVHSDNKAKHQRGKIISLFLGLELSSAYGGDGWDKGWGTLPGLQKKSVTQVPCTGDVMNITSVSLAYSLISALEFPTSLINDCLLTDLFYCSKHQEVRGGVQHWTRLILDLK